MNKKKSGKQAVSSKLTKTKVVLHSKELARHVPSTRPFSRDRLLTMLECCRMVYVKPDTGSQGIGVIRVEKKEGGFRYQSGSRKHEFSTFQAMFTSIQRRIGSRRYLIQKGIHVLRYSGRPFDFRIMIQKNPSRKWECTGTAARVAHPRKIVSNGSQGGTIFQARTLMNPIVGQEKTARLLRHMNQLARLTAAQFSRVYPAMNELGLDIAVDRSLKPWILEVNTRPDPCPFTKLDNPASIRKIVRYARAYGRSYCLTCSKAKKAPGR
ncbi:YheC/YheD family protein [Paenibacillus mendelii]|uniref:YheC/YheD family protein n=1 Tax=Paenibacillus mendelii TaxID=206163 RepID=A0ABV6JL80_9BACL|nr:YheC/YheD family protein [Paenibacillus mendelii]MCQ6562308.1 YheC/YheD family protein [Paenibacillus mendelii]